MIPPRLPPAAHAVQIVHRSDAVHTDATDELVRFAAQVAASPPAMKGASLEDLATKFARMESAAAEAVIDSLAAQAISGWRLADATFWQRVKFRARLVRASGLAKRND